MNSFLLCLAAAAVSVVANPDALPFGSPLAIDKADSQYPRAIPFGQPEPVQTLVPQLDHSPQVIEDENATLSDPSQDPEIQNKIQEFFNAYYNQEDEEDDEEAVEYFTPNYDSPSELFRRAAPDCGTLYFDCSKALTACQNGCYYQNCVNAGQTVTYADAGEAAAGQTDPADLNRVKAGTTVSQGTPCRDVPISQKMYDSWPNWNTADPNLQTDEWPMAQMSQPAFVQGGGVQNTLRCIKNGDNSRGGQQLKAFRRGQGNYNPTKGKFRNDRGGCKGVFQGGETFKVVFDISMFDMNNAADAAIVNSQLSYCKPSPDCTNDGRQFHMTKLEYATANHSPGSGRMGFPYNLASMNNYEITGESGPMDLYNVNVKITGAQSESWTATVSKTVNGVLTQAGTKTNTNLAVGSNLVVSGLPRDLTIQRIGQQACSDVLFQYGNPLSAADRLAAFTWNSEDFGFDNANGKLPGGKYCSSTSIKDSQGNAGISMTCWFPGY